MVWYLYVIQFNIQHQRQQKQQQQQPSKELFRPDETYIYIELGVP